MSETQVIRPPRQEALAQIAAVIRHQHLLLFFSLNAIKGYYAETILGWPWLILRPILPVVLFALLFGGIGEFQPQGLPYFLFLFSGFTIWNFVSLGLRFSVRSVASNRKFVTRMSFPRLILPIAGTTPAMVQFAASIGLLLIAILIYWHVDGVLYLQISKNLYLLPIPLLLTLVMVLGMGFWLSVLNVFARDVRMSLPLFLNLWLFTSPVIYPLTFVPSDLLWVIYTINPMASILDTFKWALFGVEIYDPRFLWASVATSGVIFFSGVWFFAKLEPVMVDHV